MELAAHGTYNFKRAKNVLYVDAHGPFNEITTQRYAKDINEYSYKFQNENLKSFHERKNLTNSAQSVQGRIFQIFRSYFGQREDSIFSF